MGCRTPREAYRRRRRDATPAGQQWRAARLLLGSVLSPSWEIAMLGVTNTISLANVGRNYWCGLPLSGPTS